MKFRQSTDELRWRLSNDSVVVELQRVALRLVADAMHAARERPIRP